MYKGRALDKKVVCFSCGTSYNLFVAYILSKTVYKDDYKIIVLSNGRENVRKAYENLGKLNIWDEIFLMDDTLKPFDYVEKQIEEKIDYENIDILHYFTWGAIQSRILSKCVPQKTKVILTDDGTMTYHLQESCEIFEKRYKEKGVKNRQNLIDYNKIAEIWLFDKRLYVSKLNKPLKNIEFKKYIDSDLKFEICNELNLLFDYKYEKSDWDILFFDQALFRGAIVKYPSEERKLMSEIFDIFKEFKIGIKKHPGDFLEKYKGFDIKLLYNNVPWELVYLNEYIYNKENLKNKIYMTYCSSAMFQTSIIFNDFENGSKYVFLGKLLNKFIGRSLYHEIFNEFCKRFEEIYKLKFYDIESFEELRNILVKIKN